MLERVLGQRPAVRGARVAGQPARLAGRVVRVEGDENVRVGEAVNGILGNAFQRRTDEFDGVNAFARGEKLPGQFGRGARGGSSGRRLRPGGWQRL